MCKSKYQVLYTYLLASFLALIAVANHFNFRAQSSSDAFLTEQREPVAALATTAPERDLPAISSSFSTAAANSSSAKAATAKATSTTKASASIINLGSAKREKDSPVLTATDPSLKIYERMLYAHSTFAGSNFKKLQVGSRFKVTIDGQVRTYRVISRDVYRVSNLVGTKRLEEIYYGKKGSQNIALMTCGNGQNNDSTYRLILFAAPEA